MTTDQITRLAEALEGNAFACGDEAPTDIAQEWDDEGFDADEALNWISTARCFNPVSAGMLRDAGITPQQAARAHQYDTIGYEVANGDLSIAEAVALIGSQDRMTTAEATRRLRDAAEDAEWDDAEVEGIFRALYDRDPDDDDRAIGVLSLCYAAVN